MSTIEDIKQRADIVDIISQYTSLEKAGRNFKALCPFHSEKHASFFVFPDQQSWHCFGACGTGGDVISFVMKREGIDFGQALRILADRTGVTLSPKSSAEDAAKQTLYQINSIAAEYYHHLLTSSPEGEKWQAYLDRRGILSSTVLDFQLGISQDNWDSLVRHMDARGFQENDLISAGLAIQREGGGSYDRFRNRLMFPIHDIKGGISGFGARALDDSSPKYMNTPQTAVFDKGATLYGIDRAARAIRHDDVAVIVEGYMDVLTAHQGGFENVVASMGTSLTEQQAKVLKKLTRCLALALDADAAGIQATLRGIDVVDRALDKKVVPIPTWRGLVRYESTVDAELNIIVLPPGKDPDDVIREDRAAWQCLVDGAISVMDFILDTATSQTDLNDSQGRTQVVNQVLPAIAEIREPIRQSSYLQKLAQLVRLDERFLWDALREARVSKKRHTEHMASEELIPLAVFSNPTEEYCLALTLQNPDLKTQCEEISPDYFENSAAREVFRRWLESPDIEALQDSLDPSLKSLLDHLMAKSLPPSNTTQRPHQLSDCVLRLQERWLRNLEAQKEMLLLQEAESGGADAELARLLEQGTDIPQKLHELFQKPKGKRRLRNGLGQ